MRRAAPEQAEWAAPAAWAARAARAETVPAETGRAAEAGKPERTGIDRGEEPERAGIGRVKKERESRRPMAVKTVRLKPGETLIEMRDICKTYVMGDEIVRANDNVNLTIRMGEFVSIVGKSGSGKSTLMNIIGALDVPTSGLYLLGGEDVGDMTQNELADIRNRMIGFVFQQYNLLPKLNILENVELPLVYAHVSAEEREERAYRQLERVGLGDKAKHMPNQLSGGQQQRVSIARAMAGNPSLLLADEPTGALDSKTSRQILEFFRELNDEGNTIIMITHDNSIAVQAKRVVRITDGRINFDGEAEEYASIIQTGH